VRGMLIGELADRVGVNTKTVRYYESLGLVPAPERTAGGYRLYSEDDHARLVFIKSAQHLGLTLGEIGEVLALRQSGAPPCQHVRAVLREQVATITRRITELRRLRRELQDLEATVDSIPDHEFAVCRIIEHAGGGAGHAGRS